MGEIGNLKDQLSGSVMFVATEDVGNDVNGLLVKTPVGGSWTGSKGADGKYNIVSDPGKPAAEVTPTSVNALKKEDPNSQFMQRLDARGGEEIDFQKTKTGAYIGGTAPMQGLPIPVEEAMKALDLADIKSGSMRQSSTPTANEAKIDTAVAKPADVQMKI